MNREKAKVPNVKGDWQSIEIFLFSNGQQHSPPRKYQLRVDELNLWDATLNHLAQSHYGLQSPLIDLYTTNGQLVRGPLDIRDGQAYVAVVPPDTFLDAGYQKYLMKASKSWEKRQAKKFPPECVLGEPCCLCPERQRSCCDLQACCICPEREDAESQELSASGYMDLGPPSAHFMSSATANSVAADDSEPVSGKIACATCGHVIRPGEIEYSPVQGPAKSDGYKARHDGNVVSPCEYEATPGENAARLYENRPKLSEVVARLAEYGAGSREYETRLSVNGAKPGEYVIKPSFNGAQPGEYGAKTNVNLARPDEYDTKPSVNGAKSVEYKTRPSLIGAKPDVYGVRPSENVAEPAEHEVTKQDEYKTRPSVNRTRPDEFRARPGEYENKPEEYGAKPGEYESRPSVNRAKPGDIGARLGEYETKTSVTEAKPGEYETRTSANGAKPVAYGARPDEYETSTNVNGAWTPKYGANPLEYETRTSANGAKPVAYGARPDEYETSTNINGAMPLKYGAKPMEYETRTSANGVKPGEFRARLLEYDTRPSVNGGKLGEYEAKTGEYETRPSVNGAKPGEYETRQSLNGAKLGEYETRPSLNGAKLGEYETRPSLNRALPGECETRPSLNGAKLVEYKNRPGLNGARPDDYELKSSANGAKPSGYGAKTNVDGARVGRFDAKLSVKGARPGEYETRQNINEAKPDEIGARPDDYVTRLSEQENKPDKNGPSKVKKGAWSGENGDLTASHKARPGHSGPRSSKIEPIKKAYEIALHKNEKSLNRSDRPNKDTVEKDTSIKSDFRKQDNTLGPIGENELEKKGEYRTREDDQRGQEIESKDWSSGNGSKDGERRVSSGEKNRENDTVTGLVESIISKMENSHKLRHGGVEIEQGTRTGEPTSGFEHGGRVSAQKGREDNPASKAGGQGAREYGNRPSVQTNKQSHNLARLGGHESRVGDHEARAGDLGLGSSGYNVGLENPISREAELGGKAAISGSRASPKNRMSSRPKTNLGLPKIGTPDTRADEHLVRIDDSEIKNREGNLETRQSRVGGTEAARDLHISEAQHHARKNSLTAGKPSIEKKRFSIGQKLTPLRKPTPNSTVLRKTEDKQPVKTNKENLPKKMNVKASAIPVPASNESGKSKTQRITPLTLPPTTISTTDLITNTLNKAAPDNATVETEVTFVPTHSFKNPESETGSMGLDSVKHVVDTFEKLPEETQTELIYIERSMAYASVNEGVQTDTEAVEQHGKEESASNKEKAKSCTCVRCKQLYRRVDPDENDENTLSMLNRGGEVNIKLNIQVRNIVKSVYSCQKDCGRLQSLTNITKSDKESQISIDNEMVVNRTSLQSLFKKPNFRGFGFEGSPKVMVAQCAGCGRLNDPPQCDPTPCCDNNTKYFVLLANSVLEDMEDGCNFTPPCRPCDQRQSRKQSSGIPITQAFSETTLDTITTVTVSRVPLQRRQMGKCVTNTSCQTEEPQSECGIAKRKVSITEDSVTKSNLQKRSSSSVCVTTQNLVLKQSCRKMCSQNCEREDSQVCSELCRVLCPATSENVEAVRSPSCEKFEAVCSQVPPQKCKIVEAVCSEVSPPTATCIIATCEKLRPVSSPICPTPCGIVEAICLQVTCEKVKSECSQVISQVCPQVKSNECPQTSPQVQSQGCMPPAPPTYPTCCLKLLPPCTHVQTQVCPFQGPPACNAETQTRWASILLQARLHCDGRYSFHLPPLLLLKHNNSCCQ